MVCRQACRRQVVGEGCERRLSADAVVGDGLPDGFPEFLVGSGTIQGRIRLHPIKGVAEDGPGQIIGRLVELVHFHVGETRALQFRPNWSPDGERIGHRLLRRIDPDGLGPRELSDGVDAGLAAGSGVSEAAERRYRRDRPVGVDPHDPGPD